MMLRLGVFIALIALGACQSPPEAAGNKPSSNVEIVSSRPVEASDLFADGGSFRDPSDPFWQVVIDRSGIELNGAISPTPPSMVTLPAVTSTTSGATETWVTETSRRKVQIQAVRERCIRGDGFVFRQKVTVEVAGRIFVSCGKRGSDPQPTKE